MSSPSTRPTGPGREDPTRRDFLRTAAAGVAVASGAAVSSLGQDRGAETSETLVSELHASLSREQKKAIVLPFDHPLRNRVDANWRITEARVGKSFSPDQQDLIRQIFDGLHSAEYLEAVRGQVEQDNREDRRGGFGGCSIALFGQPGTGAFEFVLTGRHVTRRCDGDSVEGAAFGGPIFYGHAAKSFKEAPDHPGNAYWFQALRANEVFQALDGKQRVLALRDDPRRERGNDTVKLSGAKTGLPGIPMTDLSADQKELVRGVMSDLLAPFRETDARECMKLVEAGGFDNLHMAFYENMDIGGDGVWDVWQLEGPAMVWYFRGSPHVHTWVHVRKPDAS